jgi:hypothetical protein
MKTREAWLEAAIKKLIPVFRKAGYTIPKKVKVSCGWPSGRPGGKTIAECWSPMCSKGGFHEIFMSPVKSRVHGTNGVLSDLIHELIHATIGNKEGHKKPFKDAMKAIGLEGRAKSSLANKELCGTIKNIAKKLGPYPHKPMTPGSRPTKTQTTRYIKVSCSKCGYICRVTRMWLGEGAPICPIHNKAMRETN